MQVETKLKLGFVATFLVMLVTAIVPFGTAYWAHGLQAQLRASQRTIEGIVGLFTLLQDAETGQRGFIITGREEFLEPYHGAAVQWPSVLADLQQRLQGRAEMAAPLQRLETLARLNLAELAHSIEVRRDRGFEPARAIALTATGKQYMDEIRRIVADLTARENQLRTQLRAELEYRSDVDAYVGLGATLVDMLLLAALLFFLARLVADRQRTMRSLQRSTQELNAGLQSLERRNAEMALLGQMTRALESPMTMSETFETLSAYCARLLPLTSGALYLFRNSRDLLEKESQWGSPEGTADTLSPQDCWALRRGQPHRLASEHDLLCPHYREADMQPQGAMCIPLIAQGEVLGLACIQPVAGQFLDTRDETLIHTVSEQVSLTLSNVRLREALRQQSIIDPLTGLFNRRYMDETLRRELSRATRKSMPLSLIVLDLDHFKKTNDLFGHDAGDALLRALSAQLKRDVRESDVACRFGGEEFVLILTECDKQAAAARAHKIADVVRLLDVRSGAQPLGPITASFGVATYPEDGIDAETLFQAADRALYLAKNRGRDRVMLAGAV